MSTILFKQYFDSVSSTYTYVFGDKRTKQIAFVDSVKEHFDFYANEIKRNGWNLCYLIETHIHADHITAAGPLQKEFKEAQIILSESALVQYPVVKAKDGEVFKCGEIAFKIILTPGHTSESMCVLIDDNRLLTGDCMFIGSCGRTDFQNGSPQDMYKSLHRIAELDEDTLIYPGHDYNGRTVSSVREEKQRNKQLQHQNVEAFTAELNSWNLPPPKKIAESVPANLNLGLF